MLGPMDTSVVNLTSRNDLVAFAEALMVPGADLRVRLDAEVGEPAERALRSALNAIAERFASDLREIARLTNTSSSSVAKNNFFLDRIAAGAAAEADLVDDAVSRLDATVESMRTLAGTARGSR